MLWLGVTTILVSVWLLKPRFPYMKGAVICALILGCVTFWGDVDTFVARYNVRAYQSGRLETIDMGHMSCLGDGALPYIKELTHDRDPEIASTADGHSGKQLLQHFGFPELDIYRVRRPEGCGLTKNSLASLLGRGGRAKRGRRGETRARCPLSHLR